MKQMKEKDKKKKKKSDKLEKKNREYLKNREDNLELEKVKLSIKEELLKKKGTESLR